MSSRLLYNMLACCKGLLPIFVGKLINPNTLAGGSVDKLSLAQINTAVSNFTGGISVEEYQISRLQLADRSVFSQLVLDIRSTW